MRKHTNLGITLDAEILTRLDKLRGDIPRSRAIEKAIVEYLKKQERET